MNNCLPTLQNLSRWEITATPDCSYCLTSETLLHVIAGCQAYLESFTRRHDSILRFLATNLQPVCNASLYVDLPGFKSPSIMTRAAYRPDLLLSISRKPLCIIELIVSFESNLTIIHHARRLNICTNTRCFRKRMFWIHRNAQLSKC